MMIPTAFGKAKLENACEKAKERAESAHTNIESLGRQAALSFEKKCHAADQTAK